MVKYNIFCLVWAFESCLLSLKLQMWISHFVFFWKLCHPDKMLNLYLYSNYNNNVVTLFNSLSSKSSKTVDNMLSHTSQHSCEFWCFLFFLFELNNLRIGCWKWKHFILELLWRAWFIIFLSSKKEYLNF